MNARNNNLKQLSVLIVEDEPHSQRELKRLLSQSGYDIHVMECIDSVEDTIDWLNDNPAPDIMFFDIQLSDGLSFEIFNHIDTNIPVIFTTAFDEYAIQAFKVNSIDYLLKPVKQVDLNASLEKFLLLKESNRTTENSLSYDQIKNLLEINKHSYKSRFISRIGDQIIYIDVNEIAYFKAEDNEVLIITFSNKSYIIDYSLEQLGSMLDPDIFYRVNRSYFINIRSILKISKYFNSRIHLKLEPDAEGDVLISRIKVPDFLNWIER